MGRLCQLRVRLGGHLASATDADGFSSHYEYDEDHRLTLDVDRAGLAFHFIYGAKGRCIESWGDYPGRRDPSLSEEVPKVLADGVTRAKGIHHCKFQYYPDGYSEVADSLQVRRFFGTKHGTVSKRVDGGDVMTATYRDDGHILSRVDAIGAITKFERDRRGRVTRVVDPLGRTTVLKRDANGSCPWRWPIAAGGRHSARAGSARGNALLISDRRGEGHECLRLRRTRPHAFRMCSRPREARRAGSCVRQAGKPRHLVTTP